MAGRVEEGGSRGFGKAVGVQQVDAEIVEVAGHDRIKARTARDQIAHAGAESCVDLSEQQFAGIEFEAAQEAVHLHERTENRLGDAAALADLFEDALVNQVEELRDDGECGDLPLLESAQEFGGVQCFEIHDTRAFDQRQHQVCHLRQHVEHGQDAEHGVGVADLQKTEDGVDLAQHVGVGELHALGVSGGAGGVEQGCDSIGRCFDGVEVAGAGGEDRVEIADPAGLRLLVRFAGRGFQ